MGLVVRKADFVACDIKGTDQPARWCRLINAFVIHSLESMTVEVATCQISIFYRVAVAKQDGLLPGPKQKTSFLTSRPILYLDGGQQPCSIYLICTHTHKNAHSGGSY